MIITKSIRSFKNSITLSFVRAASLIILKVKHLNFYSFFNDLTACSAPDQHLSLPGPGYFSCLSKTPQFFKRRDAKFLNSILSDLVVFVHL